MFLLLEDETSLNYRPRSKKCGNFCNVFSFIIIFFLLLTVLSIFGVDMGHQKFYIVYIKKDRPKYVTDEKFLSIALDSSVIAEGFRNINVTNPKLIKLMSALSPAYLRIGGTMADRLTFSTTKSTHLKHLSEELDGGDCSYSNKHCDFSLKPNFTMSGKEWLQLNRLAEKTGLKIIFGLNALKRFDNGSWDYRNAKKLINFSSQHDLDLNWELGNEPDAFRKQFNYQVTPLQMAQDFKTLRSILSSTEKYKNSLLLGPDVTRPQVNKNASQYYISEFTSNAADVIDAVTWHQYYFNGATSSIKDFLDVKNFDMLQWQINTVKDIVAREGVEKPIWLDDNFFIYKFEGETSSAYGGGAFHLSNRYIATFLWLDKLGMAAKNGLKVVIRQSIFQGHYALINTNYFPAPNWWVSVLHKKLVGNKTVDCEFSKSSKLRLYCQCTQARNFFENKPSVTVFGINLNNRKEKIRFEGIMDYYDEEFMKKSEIYQYILTTVERIDSRFIFLNKKLLKLTETNDVPDLLPQVVPAYPYVEMPPYSLAFWVIPINGSGSFYC